MTSFKQYYKTTSQDIINEGVWDWVHGALDVAGLTPILGAVPDLINVGLYGGRAAVAGLAGDKAKAAELAAYGGVSGVAAIPGPVGWAAGGAKIGKTTIKPAAAIGKSVDTLVNTGNKIQKGLKKAGVVATDAAASIAAQLGSDNLFSGLTSSDIDVPIDDNQPPVAGPPTETQLRFITFIKDNIVKIAGNLEKTLGAQPWIVPLALGIIAVLFAKKLIQG